MARTTPATAPDLGLADDEYYRGVLDSVAFVKSKKADYPDQILIIWELRQGARFHDYIGISLGLTAATKTPSKLRQLLNAIAEKPKDAEVWFDAETMEWGYDLANASSPAYAKLSKGMAVSLKGENRKGNDGITRFKATGYRSVK